MAGPWGDISPHMHKLLLAFAESRVAAMSRAQGWGAGPGQLGKVIGDTRRALSVTIVRANALCLLERLSQLGPGARDAAKRRQCALQQEERRRPLTLLGRPEELLGSAGHLCPEFKN